MAFNFLVYQPPPGTHPKAITMVMSEGRDITMVMCPGGGYANQKIECHIKLELKKNDQLTTSLLVVCLSEATHNHFLSCVSTGVGSLAF